MKEIKPETSGEKDWKKELEQLTGDSGFVLLSDCQLLVLRHFISKVEQEAEKRGEERELLRERENLDKVISLQVREAYTQGQQSILDWLGSEEFKKMYQERKGV